MVHHMYLIDYMLVVIPLTCLSLAFLVLLARLGHPKQLLWKYAVAISLVFVVIGLGSFLIAAAIVQTQ